MGEKMLFKRWEQCSGIFKKIIMEIKDENKLNSNTFKTVFL